MTDTCRARRRLLPNGEEVRCTLAFHKGRMHHDEGAHIQWLESATGYRQRIALEAIERIVP